LPVYYRINRESAYLRKLSFLLL